MNINWFTIVSIIINFFILLFILQKIFYKPVIKIMAERQERIDESLSSAKAKEEEAGQLIKSYEEKLTQTKKIRENILKDAKKEAKEKKEQWLIQYQEEAQVKRQHYFDELVEDKESFSMALQEQMVQGAIDVASGLLEDTKTIVWEESLFYSLTRKLKSYDFPAPLQEMASKEIKVVLVHAHELDEPKKSQLTEALIQSPFPPESLIYKHDTSLILGYELQLPTHTIYSSVKSYLENAEDKLSSLLDRSIYDEEN